MPSCGLVWGTDPTKESTLTESTVARRSPWLAPLLGLAAAVAGLLPWLVTGMRLPLQNLWEEQTLPGDMPIVLLPFSQYSMTGLFGLLVVGAVVGGILSRALRLTRSEFWMLLAALVAMQIVAVAQSAIVVASGLREGSDSSLYLWVIVATCVLSMLAGILALVLIARAPRAGALIGLTIGAVAAGIWVGALLQPLWLVGGNVVTTLLGLTQWIPPILTGIAIAWAGLTSIGRVVAAVGAVALVWIAPALITAVMSAVGTRVLSPRDMVEYALQIFPQALLIPELALRPIIATVLAAAIASAVAWGVRKRRATVTEVG